MKRFKQAIAIIALTFGTIACSESQEEISNSLPYLVDFEQCISNSQNICISCLADTIELVELRTPKELPISMIWEFIPIEDYWYIHTDDGVYKFTNKGEYVTTIGKYGQGPGEYSSLFNIAINRMTRKISINDYSTILFYDLDGRFMHKMEKGNRVWRTDFSDSILYSTVLGSNIDKYLLFGLNQENDTIYTIPNPYWGIETKSKGGGSFMSLAKSFYHYNNTLYFKGPGWNDTIYQLKGSQCIQYAAIDMGKYKLPLKLEAWYNYEAHWKNGYHYWNVPAIAEDERYLFILAQRYAPLNGDRANHEDIYRYLMYDKKERIGFRMNKDKDEKIIDDILGGPTIWPYWITDDYYVGLIDAYEYKEKLKEGNYKLSPEMKKVVDSWNYDTNIILMLCHKKKMNQR